MKLLLPVRLSKIAVGFLCLSLLVTAIGVAQDPFPDMEPVFLDDVVGRVDITLPADSLAEILDPANISSDYHFHATFAFDNGTISETMENVGFRLRGNTSRSAPKKSFKVSFNTYVPGRDWYGLEKLNLNGEHNDPSISRSKICWDLLRSMGVPAPRSNHVRLYINGEFYGVYMNVEHIDEEFVESRFGNKGGNLYKCLWPADLDYISDDPDAYKFGAGDRRAYELKTNEDLDDYSDLAHFIDVLNNTPAGALPCALEEVFNINTYLAAMAFDILSGNWDGPLFNKNNFYLYHNQATGRFEYIPYDLDNTFGIDWFGIYWAARDIYHWGHEEQPRPLYWRLLEVPEYRNRFSFIMQQFVQELYKESALFPRIDEIRDLIAPHVANDEYYPLSYGFDMDDFGGSFSGSLPYNHTPVGIKQFIADRRDVTLEQLDVQPIDPYVKRLTNNRPGVVSPIMVQAATVDDQGVVRAELCYQVNGLGGFTCVDMFDDGMHQDGAAGDGVYGVVLAPIQMSGTINYYVRLTDLAGNSATTPACGTLEIQVFGSSVTLVINEFMASNDGTIADAFGEFDDWVEIYNYGDEPVSLNGRYLSDNPGNPVKWQFPDMTMQPGDYLLVWADGDPGQGELHADFKLDADGEYIGIFDTDANDNVLIDGIPFGPQEPDKAFGRLPDGTGNFGSVKATPGAPNEQITATRDLGGLEITYDIFPNPTANMLYLRSEQPLTESWDVVLANLLGQVVRTGEWNGALAWDVSDLPAGVYVLGVLDGGFVELGKVVVK